MSGDYSLNGSGSRRRPVSYSELDTFRQCPLKWKWAYREGWKPEREKEAFRLGHIWHEIMQVHYGVIKEWQDEMHGGSDRSPARGSFGEEELLELCAREVGYATDGLDGETRSLMEWAYGGYVEQYGCDPDWRIVAVEIKGQVPLFAGNGGPELVYVIDLVVEDLDYGGQWIVDHKFPGDLADDFEIDLDDQLGLYWYAWSVDPEQNGKRGSLQLNGAMLNECRKKRNVGDMVPRPMNKNGTPKGKPQTPEQRFRRTRTSRSNTELWALAEDARQVVAAMEAGIVYSSPNPAQCKWKCDFREVHLATRSGEIPEGEVLHDFGFVSRAERAAQRG